MIAKKKPVHARASTQGPRIPRTARLERMRAELLAWYRRAHRDLPWRRTRDPYAVWISEIMLQQTRVDTVVPYYQRFLAALPTVHALAEAPVDRVLELWSGLGYYRRARLLHRGAGEVTEKHRGVVPREVDALLSIAGIGRYTAGAIASIAFDVEAPIVDGNVARVITRFDALAKPKTDALWKTATVLARGADPGALNQALMELGATVCTPKNPSCEACPIASACKARARGIENELPRVKKKAASKTIALNAFVIESASGILYAKRTAGALYGGMWEPPMLAAGEDPRPHIGFDLDDFERCGSFVHVLTHRRLAIDVFYTRSRRALKIRPFSDYERFEVGTTKRDTTRAMSRLARRVVEIALGQRSHFRSL